MREAFSHVSDEELIALADGELDSRRSAVVRAHLAACWPCRTRAGQMEETIAHFVQANRDDLDARIPPDDAPRAMLVARLAEARQADPSGGAFGLRPVYHWARRQGVPAAAAVALGGLALLVGLLSMRPSTVVSDPRASLNPDSGLTPGAAVFRSREAICGERRRVESPTVSRDVALAVFRTYGISDPTPNAYELDYLVSPEIGGSTDVRNLWPQPYAGRWNAHLKDALEDHLYDLVCAGEVDLLTAQRDVAADWIAAYKKYFRTDTPIEAHRTFRKDSPWR